MLGPPPPPFSQDVYRYDNSRYRHSASADNVQFTGTAWFNENYSYNEHSYWNWSYYFNGGNNYFAFPASDTLSLAYENFTIEAWINFEEKAGMGTIISNWGGIGGKRQYALRIRDDNTFAFYWAPYSTTLALCSSQALTPGEWYHVAATRSGSTFRLFVNGTQVSSGTSSAIPTGTSGTHVGRTVSTSAVHYFKGFIDELRVTRGVVRYTGNFTPPTKQFPMQ